MVGGTIPYPHDAASSAAAALTLAALVHELAHSHGREVDVLEDEVLGRAEGKRLDNADRERRRGEREELGGEKLLRVVHGDKRGRNGRAGHGVRETGESGEGR